MNIKINISELYKILELTPCNQNILLIGKHGIGKSEIISDFYRKKGMKVQAFFLGQMSDPGDLIGLMHKDEKNKTSVFLPPYWWPVDNKPIVLFLDELNRARPELLQAVQDLTLNKTLAGKTLPEGSIVVAAVNEGDEYQVTELDPALISRFNVYYFKPSVREWISWAKKNGVDNRVIEFIYRNNTYLDSNLVIKKDEAFWNDIIDKTPDRRAWKKVSDFIKEIKIPESIHIKMIAGMVGVEAALEFEKFLDNTFDVLPEEIFLKFGKKTRENLKNKTLNELSLLVEKMIMWINEKEYETENQKENEKNRLKILKNFSKFIDFLEKINKKEIIALMISILEDEKYSDAMAFLVADSDEIMSKLITYINNIEF